MNTLNGIPDAWFVVVAAVVVVSLIAKHEKEEAALELLPAPEPNGSAIHQFLSNIVDDLFCAIWCIYKREKLP